MAAECCSSCERTSKRYGRLAIPALAGLLVSATRETALMLVSYISYVKKFASLFRCHRHRVRHHVVHCRLQPVTLQFITKIWSRVFEIKKNYLRRSGVNASDRFGWMLRVSVDNFRDNRSLADSRVMWRLLLATARTQS